MCGWATSSAAMLTYLFGAGDPRWIAIGILLVIGVILTFAPVVYVMLERLIAVKIAAVASDDAVLRYGEQASGACRPSAIAIPRAPTPKSNRSSRRRSSFRRTTHSRRRCWAGR